MKTISLEECHIDKISELDHLCFSHPWSKTSHLAALIARVSHYFGVFENDILIGYGSMYTVLDEGNITNLCTHPDHRWSGVASEVLSALLDKAADLNLSFVTLEVRESNFAARQLYEKHGFVNKGIRPLYYRDPREDAVIMTKYL